MLKINNLSKSFGSTKVLNQISFEADEGDVLAVLGKNGTGKTNLLEKSEFLAYLQYNL